MQREGDEVHFETDEARGASTPNIVRWVLAISLFAAIALLSVVWITGAATRREEDKYVTVPDPAADRSSLQSTDSIVGATDVAAPTVENKAADEAPAAEPEAN